LHAARWLESQRFAVYSAYYLQDPWRVHHWRWWKQPGRATWTPYVRLAAELVRLSCLSLLGRVAGCTVPAAMLANSAAPCTTGNIGCSCAQRGCRRKLTVALGCASLVACVRSSAALYDIISLCGAALSGIGKPRGRRTMAYRAGRACGCA